MAIEKDYVTRYWDDLVAQEAGDIEPGRLSAWIETESRGFPQALGACTEVGIGQIDVQDGPKFGGSQATLHTNFCAGYCDATRVRDLDDGEERLQVTSLVGLANWCRDRANSQLAGVGASWSDDDLWCLIKLQHGLPEMARAAMAQAGSDNTSDWDSFRSYVLGQPSGYLMTVPTRYWPLDRFFNNAEKVGKLGLSGLTGSANLGLMFILAIVGFILWRIA